MGSWACHSFFLTSSLIFLTFIFTHAADPSHAVKDLPGQPHVNFKQYAGQITVNQKAGRALFYWFFEADHRNSSSFPVTIWFNGGPGCSSVGAGAFREIGPFRTNGNGTELVLNPNSWNKASHVIFLESPHSVGFSYANESTPYNDEQTANDSLEFLLQWFKKFPEYSKNDFYLAGESYAGHYAPNLAMKILKHNAGKRSIINLKGFILGNPWTDAYHDNRGDTEFYYTHAIIPENIYNELMNNCDFGKDVPVNSGDTNPRCQAAADVVRTLLSSIDHYSIYKNACGSKAQKLLPQQVFASAYDSCLDTVTPYLNLPKTQDSLNVVQKPASWSLCSPNAVQYYERNDITTSMIPVYKQLLKSSKLKIWIMSGDADAVVSTIGTRSWLKQLNLTTESSWNAWNFQGQVGGWTEVYSGLTLVTVRAAGHMVPADKPQQALHIFSHFIKGKPLASLH